MNPLHITELTKAHDANRGLFRPEAQMSEEIDALMDLHAWDPARIKPSDWLSNFGEEERPFALLMLHRFVFFPEHLTDELLVAAFHQISALLSRDKAFGQAARDWVEFRATAILTYVTGERPHPADSGFLFARKARQALGFKEQDIMAPHDVVKVVASKPGLPIVFVDDFVGSGNQFKETWHRKSACEDGKNRSFADLHQDGLLTTSYYCNAVSTATGRAMITASCPGATLLSGNVIDRQASFIDDESRQWPKTLGEVGRRLIASLAPRYGFSANDGGEEDWRGYGTLGLGIAFSHSTPDATLPIFHSDRNGWRPLVRRA